MNSDWQIIKEAAIKFFQSDIILKSLVFENEYKIISIDDDRIVIDRISGGNPANLTKQEVLVALDKLKKSGNLKKGDLIHTSLRQAMLLHLHPSVHLDKTTNEFYWKENHTKSVSVDDIIEAFIFYKPELKMNEIKDYVFEQRGQNIDGYKDKRSFNETIQDIVQSYSMGGNGYKNISIFQKISRGYYRLEDNEGMVSMWNLKIDINNEIIKLAIDRQSDDIELTTRTLREINSINRNKSLVNGLKKLYEDKCQLCDTQLQINENIFYSEVHHIKSLGEPHNGPDIATNMIVVCPNCHVLLDFKAITISKDKINLKKPHEVDDIYIEYHNQQKE